MWILKKLVKKNRGEIRTCKRRELDWVNLSTCVFMLLHQYTMNFCLAWYYLFSVCTFTLYESWHCERQGKAPTSEKSIGEEKEQCWLQTVLKSKDVENNMHSPNDLLPEHVSHIEHIVESENLVEKGKEEPNSCQQVGNIPILDERSMEQKVTIL